jgi:hypothetical protein
MPLLWNQPDFLWNAPLAVWNGPGSGSNPTQRKRMSSIVLNIRDLSDLELEARLRALAAALTDNPTAAPGIATTPAALTAAADDIKAKLDAKAVAEAAAEAATMNKNTAVAAGEELIRDYAAEAWKATGKDPAKATLLAFDVRDGSTPAPPPPGSGQMTGLTLSFGPNPGELVVKADPMPRKISIEVQVNRTPNATPSWAHERTVSATPCTLTGLPSGQLVQVRIRAIFAGGVEGPWSDIAELRVP